MPPDASPQRRVLAATSISYVVVVLDASIVNVALDRLSEALAVPIAGLQWVVNAYTLAFASLLLTGGTLGDHRGARNVYFAGLATFTLGSAGCGMAMNLQVLVCARVLQGVGAAMLVPCSLKLINQAFPEPAHRARAIGLWAGCGGVAMAAGPLVGGALVDLFGWRSIFFVNLPIGLAGMALTRRIARDRPAPEAPPFDPAGQAAAIIAVGTLIGLLIEGRTWVSPATVATVAVSIMAWIAFLAVEVRNPRPMLPLALFRDRIFAASTCVSMASALIFYGLLFVLSLHYQQVQAYSPLQAGLAFLPMTTAVAVGSIASSRIVRLCGLRWSMCGAFGFYAAGAMGLLWSGRASPYGMALVPMLAIGLAAGFVSPAATAPAMGAAAKHRAGVAAAVLNAARQAGAAFGVAIFGRLVGSFAPFEAGMHVTLWITFAVSAIAMLAWWSLAARDGGLS